MTQPMSYDRAQLGFRPVLLLQPSRWFQVESYTLIVSPSEMLFGLVPLPRYPTQAFPATTTLSS